MSDRKQVLEKIRKLLSRAATGRGNSEAEMQMAMQRAQELAVEHSIDLTSVSEGEVKVAALEMTVEQVHLRSKSKNERMQHNPILNTISTCFGVKTIKHAFRSGSKTKIMHISIVGEKADVIIAAYAWNYLEELFPECWLDYAKRNFLPSNQFVAATSYYRGLAYGIIESNTRVVDSLSKDQANRYALVLVNKEALVEQKTAELFPNLIMKQSRARQMNHAAMAAGLVKGRTIKIHTPLA